MTELGEINSDIIFYTTSDGAIRVEVLYQDETFWLTINRMAELFGTSNQSISYHLQNIYKENELDREATVKEILTVQIEGQREVSRKLEYYNLDAVIAVGYRVSSRQATQFRVWATQTLKEFIIKGFVLDDERLKQGTRFGKDYFDELLERIREIRASEQIERQVEHEHGNHAEVHVVMPVAVGNVEQVLLARFLLQLVTGALIVRVVHFLKPLRRGFL